jgi:hypothetical protein
LDIAPVDFAGLKAEIDSAHRMDQALKAAAAHARAPTSPALVVRKTLDYSFEFHNETHQTMLFRHSQSTPDQENTAPILPISSSSKHAIVIEDDPQPQMPSTQNGAPPKDNRRPASSSRKIVDDEDDGMDATSTHAEPDTDLNQEEGEAVSHLASASSTHFESDSVRILYYYSISLIYPNASNLYCRSWPNGFIARTQATWPKSQRTLK